MSSVADGHPLRKSLRRKLNNRDSFDNYARFASGDGQPTYTINFKDEDCTYTLLSLEEQFWSEIEEQSVEIRAYAKDKVLQSAVCSSL